MNLLMLTKLYPYGSGEAFIENEIKIFSEHFEKITIIACEVPKDESRIRRLPNNVISYRVDAGDKKLDALNGNLKFLLSRKTELSEEKKYCKGIVQKAFLRYFEEKSQRIYKGVLNSNCLSRIIEKPFMIYSYWLFTTARVGTLIANKYKPELMFTRTHGYDLYEERNKLNYLPYRRYLLNRYDLILPCSENGTEYLKSKYPEYSNKIRTAFLGTLDHGVGIGSDDGTFRIVSCSRVVPVKRIDRIVEALKLLDKKDIKLEWHHLGDGECLNKIKSRCSELRNTKCFFYGNIPNTEVLEIYKEKPFDLFINVSSSEGLPVSIMEAMSFGIPVVATDVGGTNEIVIEGTTGKLLDKDFTDEILANEIYEFVSMHSDDYKKYRNSCRCIWERKFQANQNYTKLCESIKKVNE